MSLASAPSFNDADATVWPKQLVDGHDIELWSGDRLVVHLNSTG
jgi:hypothetical protein